MSALTGPFASDEPCEERERSEANLSGAARLTLASVAGAPSRSAADGLSGERFHLTEVHA